MLVSFVICLREGVEAALIVSIIAVFLRKNGKGLVAVWVGVVLAVLLSAAVGVVLKQLEMALPQSSQETMEMVVGAVAVVFVTYMILWMNKHARDMKRSLEGKAGAALGRAGAHSLAVMAFLAILREGFETSVFLLAASSVVRSASLPLVGAVAGLLSAVAIGWGIYIGALRLNLSRFFRASGGVLIVVAAGLVFASMRSAHEAGFLNVGQQQVADLSWLIARGTIGEALITGMLGIEPDPRLIEVLGYFAYLVPVAVYLYWPVARSVSLRAARRLRLLGGGGLALVALGLALCVPSVATVRPGPASIINVVDNARIGTAHLYREPGNSPQTAFVAFFNEADDKKNLVQQPLAASERRDEDRDGIMVSTWMATRTTAFHGAASSLTVEQLRTLLDGRTTPVGLNPRRYPGPFTADWLVRRRITVQAVGSVLLNADGRDTAVVVLSGGGLATPRAVAVNSANALVPITKWRISPVYVARVFAELKKVASQRAERRFWAEQLPALLIVLGFVLAASSYPEVWSVRRSRPGHRQREAKVGKQIGQEPINPQLHNM